MIFERKFYSSFLLNISDGSRTIAPEENYPPTLTVTVTLTQALTLTEVGGGNFPLGQLSRRHFRLNKENFAKGFVFYNFLNLFVAVLSTSFEIQPQNILQGKVFFTTVVPYKCKTVFQSQMPRGFSGSS